MTHTIQNFFKEKDVTLQISPPHDDHYIDYINRKGFTSINCKVVAGASLKLFNVDAQWPGSEHDSSIFKQSKLYRKLENGYRPIPNGLLAGDSAYEVHYLRDPCLF